MALAKQLQQRLLKQANTSLLVCEDTAEADAMAALVHTQASTTSVPKSLIHAIPTIALGSASPLIPDNFRSPSLSCAQLKKKGRLDADA